MDLTSKTLSALVISAAAASSAHAVTFTAFSFSSQVSTSGAFSGVNGIYGNADVRLDGVSFGGNSYGPAALQTVSSTSIVLDDGLDAVNGGGNLAAGHGINAAADNWAPQGPRTVTPTGADLQAALANTNLTSIVVTRENPSTAIVDVTFAAPQKTFLFYERGANSDLQVQALNASNQVIGTYIILRANYDATGIIVSTDNGAFQLAGQALGSLGLQTDEAVTRLRLSSYRSDVINFNGPDYKVLAVTAVPEPETYALMLSGLGALVLLSRRRTLKGQK